MGHFGGIIGENKARVSPRFAGHRPGFVAFNPQPEIIFAQRLAGTRIELPQLTVSGTA
jgi:hypothetical protein